MTISFPVRLLSRLVGRQGEAHSSKNDEMRARYEFVLWLEWRCETCGWSTTIAAPGFAGDGTYHYADGSTPCGPLLARRVAALPDSSPVVPRGERHG